MFSALLNLSSMYRYRKELSSTFYSLSIHLGVVDMITITTRNLIRQLMPYAFTRPTPTIDPKVDCDIKNKAQVSVQLLGATMIITSWPIWYT